MYVPWVITGETRFEFAWQGPDPEPERGPRPHLATTRDPPLVRDLGHEDPRHRHPRRRLLGRPSQSARIAGHHPRMEGLSWPSDC